MFSFITDFSRGKLNGWRNSKLSSAISRIHEQWTSILHRRFYTTSHRSGTRAFRPDTSNSQTVRNSAGQTRPLMGCRYSFTAHLLSIIGSVQEGQRLWKNISKFPPDPDCRAAWDSIRESAGLTNREMPREIAAAGYPQVHALVPLLGLRTVRSLCEAFVLPANTPVGNTA